MADPTPAPPAKPEMLPLVLPFVAADVVLIGGLGFMLVTEIVSPLKAIAIFGSLIVLNTLVFVVRYMNAKKMPPPQDPFQQQ